MVIGKNGDIFVSDGESTNTRVVKFSKDGKFIKCWGTKGSGPGEMNVPHNIAMDSEGRLYVADRANKRIQVFDQDGKYLDQMTQFGAPASIFITKDEKAICGCWRAREPTDDSVRKTARYWIGLRASMPRIGWPSIPAAPFT